MSAARLSTWRWSFPNCHHGNRAFERAESILASVIQKAHFWEAPAGQSFHERQRLVINRLLNGFTGKLTSSKYAKLAKCLQDTTLRDIDDLLKRNILLKEPGGGRSTSYSLAVSESP